VKSHFSRHTKATAEQRGPVPKMLTGRCQNPECGMDNRLRRYSIREIPRCGNCGWPLPEPLLIRFMRAVPLWPELWIASGIAIILLGFVFISDYRPALSIVANAVLGHAFGLPYRYTFGVGMVVTLFGIGLWARRR
jgi:hypothetical protein